MKTFALCKRAFSETVRDPINLCFGLGFPVILLALLSAIQQNIPVSLFEINRLAPGIIVFAQAFLTLFTANLIAGDRQSAFILRLYSSPLSAGSFVVGYTLPMLIVALLQAIVTIAAAMLFGLEITGGVLMSLMLCLLTSVVYIAMGLLFGSILNQKQVGGICGALMTNLTAWLSGIWFDLELVGGVFLVIAKHLPFYHAVKLLQNAVSGGEIFTHLIWVTGYAAVIMLFGILLFRRQMRK